MKIKFFIVSLSFLLSQLSFALPNNFYKNDSNVRFVKLSIVIIIPLKNTTVIL